MCMAVFVAAPCAVFATGNDDKTLTSVTYVTDQVSAKQTKPSTGVAAGKVLTYGGTDANTNVSAQYIKVPVAAGAPSSNTPSSFAEVWLQ